jgi:hydroxysqualene dehydroxylase
LPGLKIGVVGGGWAGLAAAVQATSLGHHVTLFEMAPQLGGRSRSVGEAGMAPLDNGQHILIGAYTQTLVLMQTLGVNLQQAFVRSPLRLVDPQGGGLQLRAGPPVWALARGVLGLKGWRWYERLALLWAATGWVARGFRCNRSWTVAQLVASLPGKVRRELIEPLCVAALNTPACDASAAVFLRVLQDALWAGPGSADLLLPRRGLSELLPQPAVRWLQAAGARLVRSHRVGELVAQGARWQIDGELFDHVVLACTAPEAARLAQQVAPQWASMARALQYEPIVTVYLQSNNTRLPEPMLVLHASAQHPAQFVFDRGQLGGPCGLLAFVISGAQAWVDAGREATQQATLSQARSALHQHLKGPLEVLNTLTEKRATFRCTPGLQRPLMQVAPGLAAAGDYVLGPYPATLEGAVRSGVAAVECAQTGATLTPNAGCLP